MSTGVAALLVVFWVVFIAWVVRGWTDLGRRLRRTADQMRRRERDEDR